MSTDEQKAFYRMLVMLKEDMEDILKKHPLTPDGLQAQADSRMLEPEFLIQFDVYQRWLLNLKWVKSPTYGSYYLKHRCQVWMDHYVCDGAMIAAVIWQGVPHRIDSSRVSVGVSKRDIKSQNKILTLVERTVRPGCQVQYVGEVEPHKGRLFLVQEIEWDHAVCTFVDDDKASPINIRLVDLRRFNPLLDIRL